jgi:hypothetical protein
LPFGKQKRRTPSSVKYWEIIADEPKGTTKVQ